jgi:hypothetical protein
MTPTQTQFTRTADDTDAVRGDGERTADPAGEGNGGDTVESLVRERLGINAPDTQRYFGVGSRGRLYFVPARLGRELSEVVVPRVGPDGWIYRYADGVYVDDGEHFARATAQWLLDERTATAHVRESVEWIRIASRVNPISFDPDPAHIVRVGNGIRNVRDWTLAPYTPENASLIKLPWNLTEAECPRVDAFLDDVFGGDDDMVRYIREVIGYCCQARNPLRRAVLFLGSGANGKSVLLHLITCLLGEGNVATLPLGRMSGDDRFAPSSLVGKLANICGDLPSGAPRDVSLFKQITGQDSIFAERKNRDGSASGAVRSRSSRRTSIRARPTSRRRTSRGGRSFRSTSSSRRTRRRRPISRRSARTAARWRACSTSRWARCGRCSRAATSTGRPRSCVRRISIGRGSSRSPRGWRIVRPGR